MALGSTSKTHLKRAKESGAYAQRFAAAATRAAKKGQCRVAMIAFANAAAQTGMKVAEAHSATPRVRKGLYANKKQWKKAFKGFNKTLSNVLSHCHSSKKGKK